MLAGYHQCFVDVLSVCVCAVHTFLIEILFNRKRAGAGEMKIKQQELKQNVLISLFAVVGSFMYLRVRFCVLVHVAAAAYSYSRITK